MVSSNNEVAANNEIECSICLQTNFVESKNIDEEIYHFVTSCGHHFHRGCLEKWCLKNNSCPVCRTTEVMNIDYSQISVCLPGTPDIFRSSPLYYDHSSNTPSTATTAPGSGSRFNNILWSNYNISDLNNQLNDYYNNLNQELESNDYEIDNNINLRNNNILNEERESNDYEIDNNIDLNEVPDINQELNNEPNENNFNTIISNYIQRLLT